MVLQGMECINLSIIPQNDMLFDTLKLHKLKIYESQSQRLFSVQTIYHIYTLYHISLSQIYKANYYI